MHLSSYILINIVSHSFIIDSFGRDLRILHVDENILVTQLDHKQLEGRNTVF